MAQTKLSTTAETIGLIIFILLPAVSIYSLAAFTAWDWNPSHWANHARFIVGLTIIIITAIFISVAPNPFRKY